MPRTRIQMPERMIFTCDIPVRITDINYGNHLGNDSFVKIMHEARMLWLNASGITELNVGGAGLIMSELHVEFIKEGNYGDIINVEIGVGEVSKMWFELFYRLSVSAQPIANGKTVMVCYNYEVGRPIVMPEAFKKVISYEV